MAAPRNPARSVVTTGTKKTWESMNEDERSMATNLHAYATSVLKRMTTLTDINSRADLCSVRECYRDGAWLSFPAVNVGYIPSVTAVGRQLNEISSGSMDFQFVPANSSIRVRWPTARASSGELSGLARVVLMLLCMAIVWAAWDPVTSLFK